MHQGRSNYPKFQIHEKTPSILCWSEKLSGVRQRDQSLFSLLLEIESRLRKEGRNGRIEQRKRSRQRSRRKRLTNCTVDEDAQLEFDMLLQSQCALQCERYNPPTTRKRTIMNRFILPWSKPERSTDVRPYRPLYGNHYSVGSS
jgi:hypothetical protein